MENLMPNHVSDKIQHETLQSECHQESIYLSIYQSLGPWLRFFREYRFCAGQVVRPHTAAKRSYGKGTGGLQFKKIAF